MLKLNIFKKQAKTRKDFILAAIIFFLALAVYLFTLAPSITMEDSGELITAAATLGIPHPSGYPLYVLLGKLFTFIPWGTIGGRVNLLSAFFGGLTISLLYLIISRLTRNRFIAFSCSLVAAYSPIFWSQSVVSKFYTLNSFLVCLLILILLVWSEKRENRYLYWFSFLFGITLTNHTMSVLFALPFGLYILLIDFKIIRDWRLILKMFLLFLLGLAVYLYIPLRAWQRPDFNWGPITTINDVFAHITRQQYNDFSPLANPYNKVGILVTFFYSIYEQFYWPTLLLALGGLVYLWKKNRSAVYLTFGIFLLNSAGIIYLRKYGWGLGIEYTYRVYYLPAFLMIIIWLALILEYLYSFLVEFLKNKRLIFIFFQLLFFVILLSLPISFLVSNYRENDSSSFWFNYDYTKNLLASLEPNSIYYFTYDGSLQGDTEIFSLIYLKMVEKFRPDVTVVCEQNFFYKEAYIDLPKDHFKLKFEERRREIFNLLKQAKDRPIYTNFVITKNIDNVDYFGINNGYVYRIYPSLAEAKKVKPTLYLARLRNLDEINEFSSYPLKGLAAHYYYNLASFYLVNGQFKESQYYLIKAFNLDTAPFSHEYKRFISYRAEWGELKK